MFLYVFFIESILFMAVFNSTESRKYDVELEALKLYGEDLNSVLQRFRKTPDYLKILMEKMNELNQQYDFIAMQSLTHYTGELKNKISESLGLGKYETLELKTTQSTSPNLYRNYQDFRRFNNVTDGDVNPVQKLDSYKISDILTFSERNSYRDLGFEFTGRVIHGLIKHMSSDDDPVKSTRLPYGEDHDTHQKTISTTPHAHVHEVTTSSDPEKSTVAAETSTSETFLYKHRRPHK